MVRRLLKVGLRHFGYDITEYPIREWYWLRAGLLEIFAALQINCVIDVGANQGQYGDFLRQIGYKGRIVSFEPASATFKSLAERSKNDDAWHVHNLAVGAANQILDMNIMEHSEFNSLLPFNSYGNRQFAKEAGIPRTERVSVVQLDSMMDEIVAGIEDPRVYLKMDTQGYDLQVLDGASGILPLVLGLQSEIALRPIYAEMPDYLTSLAKLNALGFAVTSIVPVTRDEKMRVIEFDCLMVRDSKNCG